MHVRRLAIAVLLLACVKPGAARAQAECVPAPVLRAMTRAERAFVVRLGAPAEDGAHRHEDPPGRFMGCPELERFELQRSEIRRAAAPFADRAHLQCGDWLPGFESAGRRAGRLGVEFRGRAGAVRLLVSAGEGNAEIGFASGVRYPVRLDDAALAAWERFLEDFARGRRSTPREFLAAMLEGQPGAVAGSHEPGGPASGTATGAVVTADSSLLAAVPSGPAAGCDGPKFGSTWYVDRLPEARTRVAPSYPDEARERGVDGVVRVAVLVGCDGAPRDVFVLTGHPMLRDAAVAAVRQWRFEPATRLGRPVACWIGVPTKFTMH